MTRKDQERARELVEELLERVRGTNKDIVLELQELLGPSPTLGEIMLKIPSPTHKDRARLIGLSRQGYYNLLQGIARPNLMTTKRLADLTGLSEEVIKEASP